VSNHAGADADILNFTAWTHALAPGELDAAVAAGEKAVASDPKSASHQQTLGAVLFRAGRFEEGLEHLMEAERIAQETEVVKVSPAYTWFFLAMTHQSEARYDEAKNWYDKAMQWTDKVMQQHDDGTARLLCCAPKPRR
jgi:tetratricopeptide (TPR) repeat protein